MLPLPRNGLSPPTPRSATATAASTSRLGFQPTTLLLWLLAGVGWAVAGFDPATDVRCPTAAAGAICLSSFIWCARDGDAGRGCSFPAGADAFMPGSNAPYAVLYHNRQYEISWRQAAAGMPVLVEWLFSRELHYTVDRVGDVEVMWSANITSSNSSFTFDPREILNSFPTAAAPNVTRWQAIAAVQDASNQIRVSQPEAPLGAAPALSDQFLVHTDWSWQLMQNVRDYDQALYRQQTQLWQKGVGLGIGIGIPLAVIAACFVGHRLGKRAGFDLAEKSARRRGM